MRFRRFALPLAVTLAAGLLGVLTGCGTAGPAARTDASGPLRVVTAFYPLQWITERVGGDAVQVENLTHPGVEPHDLELTPREVGHVSIADLVVYLSGFQPAVDQAVAAQAPRTGFDVRPAARLDLTYRPDGEAQPLPHASSNPTTDPHFWLDPTRLADVATALAARLTRLAPARAGQFEANLRAVRADLAGLDRTFAATLATCQNTMLVTSHEAFGYLAERYGLTQLGISGLSPDSEPRAGELAAIARTVRAHGVHTIYTEVLASPAVAETLARETGARTAVLDPLEGITSASAGTDYLQVMRANLATLEKGQSCQPTP